MIYTIYLFYSSSREMFYVVRNRLGSHEDNDEANLLHMYVLYILHNVNILALSGFWQLRKRFSFTQVSHWPWIEDTYEWFRRLYPIQLMELGMNLMMTDGRKHSFNMRDGNLCFITANQRMGKKNFKEQISIFFFYSQTDIPYFFLLYCHISIRKLLVKQQN